MKVKLYTLRRHTAGTFWVLASVFIAGIFFYGYFVISTVFAMSVSENMEEMIRAARSDLSELERSYIGLSENVDMAGAMRLGLVVTKSDLTYIERGSTVTAYSESGDGF